ncbi:hypothetical protein SAMN06295888_10277 [Desulfonatronum zhilinae]|nr:hypothetical protein SAMN06295888_10277 [Desulfonatronum zhilinae]
METSFAVESPKASGQKQARPNPNIVIWDDEWVPNDDKKFWNFLDNTKLRRSAEHNNLPNPHDVVHMWKNDKEFLQQSPERQKALVNNLFESYSEFMNRSQKRAFDEAFGEEQDGWLSPPTAEELRNHREGWLSPPSPEELAAWEAENRQPPMTEAEFDALWRENYDPNSASIRLQTGLDNAARSVISAPGRAVRAVRDGLDRLRPEQRAWYNPAPEEIEAQTRRDESRQAAPRQAPGAGSSPLRMTNDVQLRPAGEAVVEAGRSMMDYGRRVIGGLGEYFARAREQPPVRVQHALRVVEGLQAKMENGQQLTPEEGQLFAREVAVLERSGQGQHVVRTGIDRKTGRPVAQAADGRIGFLN